MAMFTSSEDAYFVLDAPYTFFTPAGAGNLVPVRGYAFSDVILSLVAQDGTYLVNSIVCDVLPTGVSIVSGGFGGYLFRVTAAFLAGHAGFFRASLRGTVAGDMIIQNTSFQWGGTIDLLTQVPAQNILPMLNNGQPVRQTDTPTFVFLPFVDPATGLPDTSTPTMTMYPPSPGTAQVLSVTAGGMWFSNTTPTFTTAGRYFVTLESTINGVAFVAYGYVDWGDPGCVALNTNTLADTAAAQATLARKVLANKTTPNSSVTPTSLTLYEDDGVTPLGTRTIANADASAVSPTQVLDLGPFV